MMITKRSVDRAVNRALKTLIGAVPAIPYVMRSRRRTPVAVYVLGGLGIALAGGIAALMLLSPRTRSRALHAARGAYDKVNERIVHRREAAADAANGLVERLEPSTSGV